MTEYEPELGRLIEQFDATQRDMLPDLIRVLEQDDLHLIHSAALSVLERGGEPTVKELADLIGRSVSRASRLVEQLVARGLVERREDRNDRRVRRVRLSRQGASVLRPIQQRRAELTIKLMTHLTEEERGIVVRAMELLTEAARKHRDSDHPTQG